MYSDPFSWCSKDFTTAKYNVWQREVSHFKEFGYNPVPSLCHHVAFGDLSIFRSLTNKVGTTVSNSLCYCDNVKHKVWKAFGTLFSAIIILLYIQSKRFTLLNL